MTRSFEWCSGMVAPQKALPKNILVGSVEARDFRAFYGRDDVFFFSSPAQLPKELQEPVRQAEIYALLQCSLTAGGESQGYISFEELFEENRFTEEKIELLTLSARVISVFLLKQRSVDRNALSNSLLDAVFRTINKPAFILDSESYAILESNRRLCGLIGRDTAGERCHAALFRLDAPCVGCPLRICDSATTPIESDTAEADAAPCRLISCSNFDKTRLLFPSVAKISTK